VNTHVLALGGPGKLLKPHRALPAPLSPADIQLIFEIKRLREEEKLSLAAMRRQMHYKPDQVHRLPPPLPSALPENPALTLLKSIKEELQALKVLLD
jgi:hypothetical protein